jgi:hypothetical protein
MVLSVLLPHVNVNLGKKQLLHLSYSVCSFFMKKKTTTEPDLI